MQCCPIPIGGVKTCRNISRKAANLFRKANILSRKATGLTLFPSTPLYHATAAHLSTMFTEADAATDYADEANQTHLPHLSTMFTEADAATDYADEANRTTRPHHSTMFTEADAATDYADEANQTPRPFKGRGWVRGGNAGCLPYSSAKVFGVCPPHLSTPHLTSPLAGARDEVTCAAESSHADLPSRNLYYNDILLTKQLITMKKFLLRMILVATGVVAGTMSTWAGTKILYSQNYESATDGKSWTAPNITPSLKTGDATYGNYINLTCGGSNDRSAYTEFYSTTDFYEEYTSYTIEFDAAFTSGNNHSASFAIMADGYNKPGNNKHFTSSNSKSNYLLNLEVAAKKNEYTLNEGSETVTLENNVWYNIKLHVNNGVVQYTFTNKTDATTKTASYTIPEGTSYKVKGLYFLSGRYYSSLNIDNIMITTEISEDIANAPTITLTDITADKRTYTFYFGNGETLHYTDIAGTEKEATVSPLELEINTEDIATGKSISAYTTSGTAKSETISELVEPIKLNVPEIALNIFTKDEVNNIYYPTYNINITEVGVGAVTSKSTINYEFIPNNGTTTTGTGLTFTSTFPGKLIVTATCPGFETSSKEFEYKAFVKKLQADYTSKDIDLTKFENTTDASLWGDIVGIETEYYNPTTGQNLPGISNISGTNHWQLGLGYGLKEIRSYGSENKAGWIEFAYRGPIEFEVYSKEYTDPQIKFRANNKSKDYEYFSAGTILGKIYYYETIELTTKTFPASKYVSFSCTEGVTVPEGVSVYKAVVNSEATSVLMTKVETAVIPANTGVILYSDTDGDKSFIYTAETTTADFSGNAMIATSVAENATVPTEGTFYALKANAAEFAQLKGGITLSADKAYLPAPANGAKTLTMLFDGQTTGINDIHSNTAKDGKFFTLQGVEVAKPAKGLYIVNGKKVIVK